MKVWYNPIGDLGSTVYPTYGFVHQNAAVDGGQDEQQRGVTGLRLARSALTAGGR